MNNEIVAIPQYPCIHCDKPMETLRSESDGWNFVCWDENCAFEGMLWSAWNLERTRLWLHDELKINMSWPAPEQLEKTLFPNLRNSIVKAFYAEVCRRAEAN